MKQANSSRRLVDNALALVQAPTPAMMLVAKVAQDSEAAGLTPRQLYLASTSAPDAHTEKAMQTAAGLRQTAKSEHEEQRLTELTQMSQEDSNKFVANIVNLNQRQYHTKDKANANEGELRVLRRMINKLIIENQSLREAVADLMASAPPDTQFRVSYLSSSRSTQFALHHIY